MRRKCRVYQQWVSEALNGTLPPALRQKLEAHLRACGDCRSFQRELRQLLEVIHRLPPVEPPADLPQRIVARAWRERPPSRSLIPFPVHVGAQRWMAFGAALVALLVGFWLGRTVWHPPSPSSAVAPSVTVAASPAPSITLEPGQGLLEEFLQDAASAESVNPLGETTLSLASLRQMSRPGGP